MKKLKIILSVLLSLLLVLAAAGLMAWLLPVRVTLFIVIVLQVLMLAGFDSEVQQRKNRNGHE